MTTNSTPPPVLYQRPEARTESVEDLLVRFGRGLMRVPSFQRPLKWTSSEVLELFDSIYRGYPIGSLLLWRRGAAAARLYIGPLTIDAPETSAAWWVVDGQQRLTSLACSLLRPLPVPDEASDPYLVYFDPDAERFVAPPKLGVRPARWISVARLLDAAQLAGWMMSWQFVRDDVLRTRVFEAGKRIREYKVPLYLVETDDEALLREIFYRVNNTGKRLEWNEVHDALMGGGNAAPSTLTELADELAQLGMGRFDDQQLLTYLVAIRGLDVTRNLAEHRRRDPHVLDGAVEEALVVMRRLLSFLRSHAGIPHIRLLPRAAPAIALARMFALHPEPRARTLELLRRFFWRSTLLLVARSPDERTLQRHGVASIKPGDEEGSAQALLKLLRSSLSQTSQASNVSFTLPQKFDARTAATRIALLALASLEPRELDNGQLVDVRALIENEDSRAFARMIHSTALASERLASPGNRMLHPGRQLLKQVRAWIASHGSDDPVLRSHGITARAAQLLEKGDYQAFIGERHQYLQERARSLCEAQAAWSHSDRPSIEYLLAQDEDEQ